MPTTTAHAVPRVWIGRWFDAHDAPDEDVIGAAGQITQGGFEWHRSLNRGAGSHA